MINVRESFNFIIDDNDEDIFVRYKGEEIQGLILYFSTNNKYHQTSIGPITRDELIIIKNTIDDYLDNS